MTRNGTSLVDPIEERLRAALEDLRPADGAPNLLRARVAEVPGRVGSTGVLALIRGLLVTPSTAAVLIASAAIVVLAIAFRQAVAPAIPDVGGAPAPTFDPTLEGPGLIASGGMPTLVLAEALSAIVLASSAIWALLRARSSGRRWLHILAGVTTIACAVAIVWLCSVQGIGVGGFNGYGPVSGFSRAEPPTQDGGSADGLRTLYLDTRPREPFVFFFVVVNTGPIPVEFDGIVEDPDAASVIEPRWTELALGTDPNAFGQPIEQLAPFRPVTLAPGEYLPLYVTGKSSACAAGPNALSPGRSYAIRGPNIQLAYSVFGMTGTSVYAGPLQIAEPLVDGCTG
jgi:hypothetical protein